MQTLFENNNNTKNMKKLTKNQLAKEIFSVSYLRGEFLLRSGVISNEYFDKYQFESRPELLSEVAKYLADIVPSGVDALAALEMGGIPIATALSFQTGLPLALVRKKAKEHGTKKIAEGCDIKGKRLLIVEDVVTSGGQVIISANELRKEGASIEDAVCVIDREAGGKEKLFDAGIKLHPLFTITELKTEHIK